MSSNNKNNIEEVSHLNINITEIKQEVAQDKISEKEYKRFCKKYTGINFANYKVRDLKHICDMGNGLLDQYFIVSEKDKNIFEDKNIIIKLQHIVNLMVYTIMNKENQELYVQNKSLNKQLKENIKEAQELRKESDNKNKEIEHIKNDMKSITTTIISIILAVSIIPAAIIGIEKINPEYILSFVSTVILFGMVMITFVYSIYQDKIKVSTWIILISMLIFTIVLWINNVNPIVKINKDSDVTEDITVENNQQEELAT